MKQVVLRRVSHRSDYVLNFPLIDWSNLMKYLAPNQVLHIDWT